MSTQGAILVTGATGFIGQHLCYTLRQSNFRVREAVRLVPPHQDNTRDIIAVGNIDGRTNWLPMLGNIDTIVHLAARAHVLKETAADPLTMFRQVNVDGTERLAQQAAISGVRRFIFISSIGVNGENTPPGTAFSEESPAEPVSLYAKAKWEAELALRAIQSSSSLEVLIVRPPLVYGPGAPGNMQRLVKWVARGVPLPLGNTGNRRSFVGVSNLAHFLQTLIRSTVSNELFLVSDNRNLSTTEMIKMIGSALGRSPRLYSLPTGAVRSVTNLARQERLFNQLWGDLVINSDKAQKLLSWQPPFSVESEIERMVSAYAAQNKRL